MREDIQRQDFLLHRALYTLRRDMTALQQCRGGRVLRDESGFDGNDTQRVNTDILSLCYYCVKPIQLY